MPQKIFDEEPTLIQLQVMAWCHEATSHCKPEPILTQFYVTIWHHWAIIMQLLNEEKFEFNLYGYEPNHDNPSVWSIGLWWDLGTPYPGKYFWFSQKLCERGNEMALNWSLFALWFLFSDGRKLWYQWFVYSVNMIDQLFMAEWCHIGT